MKFSNQHVDDDPYGTYEFKVGIDGTDFAVFMEVRGLGVTANLLEYRQGGVHDTVEKLPQGTSFPDVTFSKGGSDSRNFVDWILSAFTKDRTSVQKDVQVSVLDNGTTVREWKLANSLPVYWSGPDFDATTTSIGMRALTVKYEELVSVQ